MTKVAVWRSDAREYPATPPYHPSAVTSELARAGLTDAEPANGVYGAVRGMLRLWGLDREHVGTADWNPLGDYVRPGDKVVIKPNFVLHEFGAQEGASCLTTHGAILRAVLDYVYLAAGPEGRIVIADAPLQGADFDRVLETAGIRRIQEYYRKKLRCEIDVLDLRRIHAVIDERSSLIRRVEPLKGDPSGYCEIDLADQSRLNELDGNQTRYVVGDYDATVTNTRHRPQRHSYDVSRTLLDSDAVICVPKLKTHSKAGVTVCLKNMVGIIGSKDCLPHHRHGKVSQGGDEFPSDYPATWLWSARANSVLQGHVPVYIWRFLRTLAGVFLGAGTPMNGKASRSSFFPSGGWHGNDTIWRTVDDLNRVLFFYDLRKADVQAKARRRYFAIVDGIIAMEGNGPLRGHPKPTGLILGGDDPLAIDVVAATLMGFDWKQIRMLQGIASSSHTARYSEFAGDESSIELVSNDPGWDSLESLRHNSLRFSSPNGWRDLVESTYAG